MLPHEANLHPFPSNSINLGYWRQLSLMSGNACWREFLAKVSWHIHLQEGCTGHGAKQFAALEALPKSRPRGASATFCGVRGSNGAHTPEFSKSTSTCRREIRARGDDRKAALAC